MMLDLNNIKITLRVERRFWRMVSTVEDKKGCLLWLGTKNRQGYGLFVLEGKQYLAHRISYKLKRGEIPKNTCVLHHCDNTSCVRPSHLFLGTQADNVKDCQTKGRLMRGEAHFRSKLSNNSVRMIRELFCLGATLSQISNFIGISIPVASQVANRKAWKHIR